MNAAYTLSLMQGETAFENEKLALDRAKRARKDFHAGKEGGSNGSNGSASGRNSYDMAAGDRYQDAEKAAELRKKERRETGEENLSLRDREFNTRQAAMEAATKRQEQRQQEDRGRMLAMAR
jgi:hypothetical protein